MLWHARGDQGKIYQKAKDGYQLQNWFEQNKKSLAVAVVQMSTIEQLAMPMQAMQYCQQRKLQYQRRKQVKICKVLKILKFQKVAKVTNSFFCGTAGQQTKRTTAKNQTKKQNTKDQDTSQNEVIMSNAV